MTLLVNSDSDSSVPGGGMSALRTLPHESSPHPYDEGTIGPFVLQRKRFEMPHC